MSSKEATEIIRGLKQLSCEELGLFSMEREGSEMTSLWPSSTYRALIKRRERDFWKGHVVTGQGAGVFLKLKNLDMSWLHLGNSIAPELASPKEQKVCPKRDNALLIALVISPISCLIPSCTLLIGISRHFPRKCFVDNGYYFFFFFLGTFREIFVCINLAHTGTLYFLVSCGSTVLIIP